MESQPRYLRRNEAAEYLKISVRLLDRLAAKGRLPLIRLDGVILYSAQALDDHLRGLQATVPREDIKI